MAEHINLENLRAIKRIKKCHLAYQQVMNEVSILKSLNHPCIPIIYDIEEEQEYSYIIEEFVEGESLKVYRLSKNGISDREVLSLAVQVCDVIQYLHNQKESILYLDLKPENIILKNGQIKLLDFGTALRLNQINDSSLSFGSLGYASPEQFKGNMDKRSDVYSIGAFIFFLVTGRRYQKSVVSLKWTWMLLSNSRLYKIIEKCLRTDPSKRFQSVESISKQLRLLQKTASINGTNLAMSYYNVAVAGTMHRVGTTHICMCIASYLAEIYKRAIYIEENSSDIVDELFCNSSYIKKVWGKKLNLVSASGWKVCDKKEEYRFRIYDFGELSETNFEKFLSYEHRVLIFGTKAWEMKQTLYWFRKLYGSKDILFVANRSEAERWLEIRRLVQPEYFLNVPFLPEGFGMGIRGTVKDFLDDFCMYLGRHIDILEHTERRN